MPRIETFTASGGTATPRYPGNLPVPEVTDASLIGAAGGRLGTSLGELGGRLAYEDRLKQEQTDRSNVTQTSTDYNVRLDEAWRAKLDDPEFVGNPKGWESGLTEVEKTVTEDVLAQNNLTGRGKRLFNDWRVGNLDKRVIDVRNKADVVWKDQQATNINSLTDKLAEMRGTDPNEANRVWAEQTFSDEIQHALDKKWITNVQAYAAQRRFVDHAENKELAVEVKTNPEKYLSDRLNTNRYDTFPLEKLAVADDQAKNRIARINSLTDKDNKKALDENYTNVENLIVNGKYEDAQALVIQYSNGRQLAKGAATELTTRISQARTEIPNDPATFDRVGQDVTSMYPKTTSKDIARLVDARLLNGKTGMDFNMKITEAAQRNADHSKDADRYAHSQVVTQLRADSGIKADFSEAMLKEDPRYIPYTEALNIINKRSVATGGTESPYAVYEEIKPALRASLKAAADNEVGKLSPFLRFPTAADLKAARDRGEINKQIWDQQNDLLRRIQNLAPTPPAASPTPKVSLPSYGGTIPLEPGTTTPRKR